MIFHAAGKLFMGILAAGARMVPGSISIASLSKSYAGRSDERPILQLQALTRKALKLQLAAAITEVLMQARILKATVARA
jgi:hypothetical protein